MLFVFMWLLIPIEAQKLIVKSFQSDVTNISASKFRRMSDSGKNCALIKVQVVGDVSDVKGDVVGEILAEGAVTWVYLEPGSKQVIVSVSGFDPIQVDFIDYGIPELERLQTYNLILIDADKKEVEITDPNNPTEPKAQFELAEDFFYGRSSKDRDRRRAFHWYYEAANQGYADAQNMVGECYYWGAGVLPDTTEAVKWIRMAAEQGLPSAQYRLADFYFNGYGVEQNNQQAIKLYELAANQGFTNAQNALGNIYSGYYTDVEPFYDIKQAIYWYEQAANNGYSVAQYQLGKIYLDGDSVKKDKKKAIYWLEKAAQNGYDLAKMYLKKLTDKY